MKNKVKRLVNFRVDHYRDIELRLEKLAARGLFLETCGSFLWTFTRGEPKKRHYTVTYFPEGSVFNPGITDNQQTYFEYAAAAGWDFVTQSNQMQIFCSEAENPVPFETDEAEKFKNIKRCMKKSFLPAMFLLLLVFLFNLVMQLHWFQSSPIEYLSNVTQLFSAAMISLGVFYGAYVLLDYLVWCRRSARSIAGGGACFENTGRAHRIVDMVFLCGTFGLFGFFLLHMLGQGDWFTLLLSVMQVPILMILFSSSIKYLKKKKASAMLNRVLSTVILFLASFAYLAFILLLILRFGFPAVDTSDYRTVTWEMTPTESHDYRLYSDAIPLTCEDLYGVIAYDYYSYEKAVESTIFLTVSHYDQNSLPAKDSPPELAYEVLEPRFGFVRDLAKKELPTTPEWWDEYRFQPADNALFGTVEAYQLYYDDSPQGEYVLFFEDKIVTLNMEQPPTSPQVAVIREKLQF